jgi:hypothetical protein
MVAHVLAHLGPDGQQHALPLVVAGAVLVGLAEVARHDGSVHGADDLTEGDLRRRAGEYIAPADPALRSNEACALQGEENLLEVRLRQPSALGDVTNRRRWGFARPQGEREQRTAGVVAPRRDLHVPMLRRAPASPPATRPETALHHEMGMVTMKCRWVTTNQGSSRRRGDGPGRRYLVSTGQVSTGQVSTGQGGFRL